MWHLDAPQYYPTYPDRFEECIENTSCFASPGDVTESPRPRVPSVSDEFPSSEYWPREDPVFQSLPQINYIPIPHHPKLSASRHFDRRCDVISRYAKPSEHYPTPREEWSDSEDCWTVEDESCHNEAFPTYVPSLHMEKLLVPMEREHLAISPATMRSCNVHRPISWHPHVDYNFCQSDSSCCDALAEDEAGCEVPEALEYPKLFFSRHAPRRYSHRLAPYSRERCARISNHLVPLRYPSCTEEDSLVSYVDDGISPESFGHGTCRSGDSSPSSPDEHEEKPAPESWDSFQPLIVGHSPLDSAPIPSGADCFMSGNRSGPFVYTREERLARIERYRQKRKNRKFDKTVRYQCRKVLAASRTRVGGRFTKESAEKAAASA
eukprot:CAMPEP_0196668534 /NCGR_PEP_ID=MMETSP1086-20130531/65671_1 /TAXON_ID=77921 /ORGANISM="Cyanoptyche  gloeocystis , Strain SAG4.97" /LENGTH=378 /DNA_ID=CAMNT_0042005949 /DNA_START=77 /DNA_END=1213 /DNA_ORIENTATION=-